MGFEFINSCSHCLKIYFDSASSWLLPFFSIAHIVLLSLALCLNKTETLLIRMQNR